MTTTASPVVAGAPPTVAPPATAPPSQLRADLEAALRYLDGHGWCQHVSVDDDGRVCVQGATAHAVLGAGRYVLVGRSFDVRWLACDAALKAQLSARWYDVPDFNDHGDTTLADIRGLFARAIDAAR